MQHRARTAIAAAVVATVGFGVTAPVATAAPKAHHVKVAKAKAHAKGQERVLEVFTRNVQRQAAAIQAKVAANAALVGENAEAAAANTAAGTAATDAVTKLTSITVATLKADRRAVRADLHTARVALETVETLLGGDESDETIVTDPAVADPEDSGDTLVP